MPDEPTAAQRCCKRVYDSTGWHEYPCLRKGTVERDGLWFCWQHDPERVKAESARKQAEWDAKWAAKKTKRQWRPDAEQFLRDFLLWLAVGSPAGEVSRELSARARQLLGKERADAE